MKLIARIFIVLCCAATCSAAERPALKKEKFSLGHWEQREGYVQAVRVGNTVYVSGSVGKGNMAEAIKQAYDTIEKSLAAYDLGFKHVVKENIFTTDAKAFRSNLNVRRAYYAEDFPAATWVEVERLYAPEFIIEVDVIAVIPDEETTASGD